MSSPIGGSNGGGNFNPLEDLIGGLVGTIGKLLKGPDLSCIAQAGKSMLNKVGSFSDVSSSTGGSGSDSSQAAAATEFSPSKDPATAQAGYQQQSVADDEETTDEGTSAPELDQSADAQIGSSSFAETAQSSSNGRASSTSAATADVHQIPPNDGVTHLGAAQTAQSSANDAAARAAEQQANVDCASTLLAGFNALDHYGQAGDFNDGRFNRDSLTNVANDPGMPSDLRDAAKYLLAHPRLMTQLQLLTGGGDQSFSVKALAEYAQKATVPSGPSAPPSQTVACSGGPWSQGVGSAPAAPNGPTDGQLGSQPTPSPQAPSLPPATNLDDKLAQMATSLEDKQNLLMELQAKETRGEPMSVDEKIALKNLPTQIQQAVERYTQMHDLVSNLMKAFHEMSMNSIRHIG